MRSWPNRKHKLRLFCERNSKLILLCHTALDSLLYAFDRQHLIPSVWRAKISIALCYENILHFQNFNDFPRTHFGLIICIFWLLTRVWQNIWYVQHCTSKIHSSMSAILYFRPPPGGKYLVGSSRQTIYSSCKGKNFEKRSSNRFAIRPLLRSLDACICRWLHPLFSFRALWGLSLLNRRFDTVMFFRSGSL